MLKSVWVALILIIGLTGCAYNSIFINYPSQIAPFKQQLNSSTPEANIKELADNINGNDGLLYAQEAGRIMQIAGNFTRSKTYYQQAINAYQAFDDKATVSASKIGAGASSILLNDNAIPYRGPGYERIMLHQYQALNYLFSGDSQGALVEVRRSNELQSMEQARYQQSQKSVQNMANGTIDAQVAQLSQEAGSVTSSFLNAYSYYVTGLLHELANEPNDAFIDYRKAAQITPDNTYLQQDLVRLAKQLAMPQYDEFKKRWGDAVLPTANQGQVVFIVERHFVPEKQSITVPFLLSGNWQTASLATYPPQHQSLDESKIHGLDQTLVAQNIANINALAINALKEDLPAALFRQAARVYAKYRLNQSAQSNSRSANNQIDAGAMVMQIFNIISEQADRRSWLTLPRQAQIAKQFATAGDYVISLNDSQNVKVEVKPNRTTLIWAIETGNYTRFYSIII
ncbi:COG3014 family protein [Shewanella sp. A14]